MKNFFLLVLFFPVLTYAQPISTFAGCGSCAGLGDGGPATNARLNNPGGIAFNSAGDLYVVSSNRIRKIDVSGTISTVAGTGTAGYTGDSGPATAAQLNMPNGIALDSVGNIFFSDKYNYAIRKVDITTGMITTICGNGTQGYTGDGGAASIAKLYSPESISFDRVGNLYIAENNKHVVRMINTLGIINTIAGTGVNGFSGDGSSAILAQLYFPASVAVDDTGNIYISDQANYRIRKINTAGVISTFAGNGMSTYFGDGSLATSAQFAPNFIRFDKNSNLYIAVADERVSKIGTDGIFHTVAGNGTAAYGGDGGAATAASMHNPLDVAFDACNNLYISTPADNRIRKVTFNPPSTASIAVTGISSATIGSTVTVNATVSNAGSVYTVKWFKNSVLFSTTSTPTTTYTKGLGTDTITARVVPAVTYCFDSSMSAAHYITVPVGVDDISGTTAVVNVYPNPAHDAITISANGTPLHSVSISNLLGRDVVYKEGGTSTEMQLPIGHLPQGIYLVRVNGVYVRRFVKE